jgi:hypothetical protein
MEYFAFVYYCYDRKLLSGLVRQSAVSYIEQYHVLIACFVLFQHFQDVEEAHLKQMKEFLSTYAEVLQNNHDLIGQVSFLHGR